MTAHGWGCCLPLLNLVSRVCACKSSLIYQLFLPAPQPIVKGRFRFLCIGFDILVPLGSNCFRYPDQDNWLLLFGWMAAEDRAGDVFEWRWVSNSSCIAGPQSCKMPGAGQVELRAGQNAAWAVSTRNSQTLSVLEEAMSQAFLFQDPEKWKALILRNEQRNVLHTCHLRAVWTQSNYCSKYHKLASLQVAEVCLSQA